MRLSPCKSTHVSNAFVEDKVKVKWNTLKRFQELSVWPHWLFSFTINLLYCTEKYYRIIAYYKSLNLMRLLINLFLSVSLSIHLYLRIVVFSHSNYKSLFSSQIFLLIDKVSIQASFKEYQKIGNYTEDMNFS